MNKTHYEIALIVGRKGFEVEFARAALLGAGVSHQDIIEQEGKKECSLSVFFAGKAGADELYIFLKKLKIKNIRILRKVHRRTDWETRWKKGWKPFSLTEKIQLIPLFLSKAKCPKNKRPLYLDTTAAFGTGLHETTRFSAQLIEGLEGQFKTFLDVGTGSGILVAVALISGAVYVEAFDIDRSAVKVAAENLKVNGLRCDVLKSCDVQKYSSRREFDLVAANLITHDLVAFKHKIISLVSSGGHLVISGISLSNMGIVRKEYGRLPGIKIVKVFKGKEWAAFLLCKI